MRKNHAGWLGGGILAAALAAAPGTAQALNDAAFVSHSVPGSVTRGGALAVEHDDSQGAAVPDLLRASGAYDRIEDHLDLAGRPRFASAFRLAD